MKFKKIFHRKSFTLLEIMLASSILTIGVVAVVKAIATGIKIDYNKEGQSTALNYAIQKMEALKNTTYSSLSSSSTTTGDYTITWTITDHTNVDSKSTYKTVDVTVSWTYRNSTQSVALSTYIANLTPYA